MKYSDSRSYVELNTAKYIVGVSKSSNLPFCRFPSMNFLYLANINSVESEYSAAGNFLSTKASVHKSRNDYGSVVLLVSTWSVNYQCRPL